MVFDRKHSLYNVDDDSLSKEHMPAPYGEPFSYTVNNQEFKVEYWPADSKSGMFGGNSNWRGPIWLGMISLTTHLTFSCQFPSHRESPAFLDVLPQ